VKSLALLIPGLIAIVAGFWPTWRELGAKLLEDETYQHGLLVPPIVAWLVWISAPRLRGVRVEASTLGLLAMLACGAAWVVGRVAGVNVVEQYAAVAMIPALVLAALGPAVLRQLAFPLGYLFLVVPVGQALVPALMEFTADFTVAAIRLSGIPVYREGLYFSLPSGDFEVAKACSGIRYLMASIATGALIAYLSFRSWPRRLAFMGFAIVLPILANGLRAYLIVIAAHFSDLQIATGADHLVYGWLFFGVVTIVLLAVARRFADAPAEADSAAAAATAASVGETSRAPVPAWRSALLPALVALLSAAYFAWVQARLPSLPAAGQPASIALPEALPGWSRAANAAPEWRPGYHGAVAEGAATYRQGDRRIEVYVADFASGAPDGREMISYRNQMHSQGENHRDIVTHRRIGGSDQGAPLDVAAVDVPAATSSRAAARQVRFWFEVGDRPTTSPYVVKALEAASVLAGAPARQRLVVVSAEATDDGELSDALDAAALAAFAALRQSGPAEATRRER
jgi:exosortase A